MASTLLIISKKSDTQSLLSRLWPYSSLNKTSERLIRTKNQAIIDEKKFFEKYGSIDINIYEKCNKELNDDYFFKKATEFAEILDDDGNEWSTKNPDTRWKQYNEDKIEVWTNNWIDNKSWREGPQTSEPEPFNGNIQELLDNNIDCILTPDNIWYEINTFEEDQLEEFLKYYLSKECTFNLLQIDEDWSREKAIEENLNW